MKSHLFDNRVQVNVALFQNTIKGEQLTIQESPTTNPSLTNTFNSPVDKEVKGVEIELFWAAHGQPRDRRNFAFMDVEEWSEYDNPFTPTVVDLIPLLHGQHAGEVGLGVPRLGIAGVGHWSSTPTTLFADGNYWTTPGAQHMASFLPTYVRPEADLENWSARLGYTFDASDGGQMEVALWGKNLHGRLVDRLRLRRLRFRWRVLRLPRGAAHIRRRDEVRVLTYATLRMEIRRRFGAAFAWHYCSALDAANRAAEGARSVSTRIGASARFACGAAAAGCAHVRGPR